MLPWLYLGNAFHARQEQCLRDLNISALLNVCSSLDRAPTNSRFSYKKISIDDNSTADVLQWFPDAIKYIGELLTGCFFSILSHFYVGSMFLKRCLHLSYASSPDNSLSHKSFLMLSSPLRFGLPLHLFPRPSITITLLPTYSSSLLNTCPYHFTFLHFLGYFSRLRCPSNSSIPYSVHLVTPLIHLNTLTAKDGDLRLSAPNA